MKIVLASTSPYRRALMETLGLQFIAVKPSVDESELKRDQRHLPPPELCKYLAFKKAESCHQFNQITIGSDQLLALEGEIFDKPGSKEKAFDHLKKLSGKTHTLVTSLCVLYKDKVFEAIEITELKMLALTDEQIESYLKIVEPYDCVGAYKIEQLGMWLFEEIKTQDWLAIQGLPMKALVKILRKLQIDGLIERG